MFGNYITATMRSLVRHKLYALINVLGLGIGLTACLLIFMYIDHETSYDKSIGDIDRLYRIETESNIPKRDSRMIARYVGPAYDLLPADFPEIDKMLRLGVSGGGVRLNGESIFERFIYTDPDFFYLLNFPFLEGSPETALKNPTDMVITKEMAIKYLGEGPYLGRELVINDVYERSHVVTGVIENLPENSHVRLDILMLHDQKVDADSGPEGNTDLQRWNSLPFYTYIKLKEGYSIDGLKAGINDWMDKYFPENIIRLVNIKGSELFTPKIIKVSDIHLYSEAAGDMKPHGSLTLIYSFTAIASLILFIAIINFMNLATARATLRAKEIAIRKVVGAGRSHLFLQFEIESMLYSFFALLVAAVLTYICLPYFAQYTDRVISFDLLLAPEMVISAILITLLTGLIAGLYPAIYLSGLRPSITLNSNQSGATSNTKLRAALVIFQFGISAVLIIVTCIIFAQTNFSRSRDLGYDRTSKMILRGLGDPQVTESKETFKNRVAGVPGVKSASLASFAPGDFSGTGSSVQMPGDAERSIIFIRSVDTDFFPMYDVQPLAGRLFDARYSNDRLVFDDENPPSKDNPANANVVVNVSAMRRMGFATPAEALGKIYYRGEDNELVQTIIGVIPDIHFVTPRIKMDAEIYYYQPSDQNTLTVHYSPEQEERVGEEIDAIIEDMYPRIIILRQFMEQEIAAQFESEETQGVLLMIFSMLAILVACMGLYGLSSFTIHRRTKEIGIRKVHGASMASIIMMLLKQFSVPVAISNVLAWPLAYYAMTQWLQNFEYRLDMSIWFTAVAVLSIVLTLSIAWLTVMRHAWSVARTNPIHALRHE